ncbi:hypothetical protein [Sulfurimonas sp. NWX79]|uniref:YobI family P-loop NTPase n=1 Tax=Sulfurimonas sp. NWX79 TaxID=2925412 RepID=UPI0032048041
MINFQFLTPSKQAQNVEVYINALTKALEQTDVRNIAISGSYGTGKSSFLKTFESNCDKRYKFLDISLATFKEDTKDISLVEKSILQQIFYRVEQSQIPKSRFKRINTVKWVKSKSLFIILFILSYMIFFDSKYTEFLHYLNDIKWISLIILIGGLFYFIKSLIKDFGGISLEKLNLQNLEIKTNKDDESSLLNNYLDEILYFFSQTDYNVVVFQDLDRFENIEIFTKLRELNSFINNSEQVKKKHKKVVFLYAIKDDMFNDKENNRVKFFDFLIPIIPYINISTSYEKLIELFKDDLDNTNIKNPITKDFLRDISLYIQDMRLLKNIYNEYKIYEKSIGNNLNRIQLLSMVLYKNFYPNDFAKLHKGDSFLNNIFNNRYRYIKALDEIYIGKMGKLRDKIKNIEKENISDIKELRMIYIYKIIEDLGHIQGHIYCDNQNILLNTTTNDDKFKLIQECSSIKYDRYNGNVKFKDIENKIDKNFTYKQREDIIVNKTNSQISILENNIDEIHKQRERLNRYTIQELSQQEVSQKLLNRYLGSYDLLKYLIFNGHIDENYYMYLSNSFKNSLTPNDINFLKSVINNTPLEYTYSLNNMNELIYKLNLNEFNKEAILNYDLVEYLIEHKDDFKEQYNVIFQQLSNERKASVKFIVEYINYLPETNIFIKEIALNWSDIWEYIYERSNIALDNYTRYFYILLYNLSEEELVALNKKDSIKKFLEELTELKDLVKKDNQKLQLLITNLDVKFYKLSNPISNRSLFEYIYENNNYVLNKLMIEQFIYVKYATKTDIERELYSKHLTTIKQLDSYKKLISNIENNINYYIKNIFLQIDTNTQESQDVIVWLLNNDELEEKLKFEIIQKEETILEDLSKIDKIFWKTLFEQNKIKATWENLSLYYEYIDKKLDNILVDYLNIEKNARELSKIKIDDKYCENNENFDNTILDDIVVTNDFDLSSYNKLLQSNGYQYSDIDISNLNSEKIDVLLEQNKLQLSSENITNLQEYFQNKHLQLIKYYFDNFVNNIQAYQSIFNDNDFELILNLKDIVDTKKIQLLQSIDLASFPINETLALKISQLYFDEKQAMTKELLDQIIKFLPHKNKLEIFVFQLAYNDDLDCEDIKKYLELIGDTYSQLCTTGTSPINLEKNQNTETLLQILKEEECISSYSIKDKKIIVYRFKK